MKENALRSITNSLVWANKYAAACTFYMSKEVFRLKTAHLQEFHGVREFKPRCYIHGRVYASWNRERERHVSELVRADSPAGLIGDIREKLQNLVT